MRDASTRSFGAVGGQGYREQKARRKKRNMLIAGISVISLAILLFVILIIGEVNGWFAKAPGDKDKDGGIHGFDIDFEDKMMSSSDIHTGDLILINSSYPYVFPDNPPNFLPLYNNRNQHDYVNKNGEIKKVYSYYTQSAKNCAKLEPDTLKALNEWADDFFKATNNIDLFVYDRDGYRSKDDQSAFHSENPVRYGDVGTTEHHTGKSIDLYVYTIDHVKGNLDDAEFAGTFKWIYDNAYKYGFIHRYPSEKESITGEKTEPYHFRNVGYAHAYYMFKNNLCLEEYLDKLQEDYSFENPLQFAGDNGKDYLVYYAGKSADGFTSVKVPKENQNGVSYTISGDNMGGFIVTVEIDK